MNDSKPSIPSIFLFHNSNIFKFLSRLIDLLKTIFIKIIILQQSLGLA